MPPTHRAGAAAPIRVRNPSGAALHAGTTAACYAWIKIWKFGFGERAGNTSARGLIIMLENDIICCAYYAYLSLGQEQR